MTTPPKNTAHSNPGADSTRRCIDSRELLGESKAVEIDHAGQRYLLRVTRENKLILTK